MYSLSSLFLLAQASPVRTPLWVVIVAPIAVASITALATLAATGITLSRTNRREEKRLDTEERREEKRLNHEERMEEKRLDNEEQRQGEQLKHEREEAWRAERKEAYSVFFSIARDIAATRNVVPPGQSNVPSGGRATPEDLREAHATVELVAESKELVSAADIIYEECKLILKGKPPASNSTSYRDARMTFLNSARAELRLPPKS